MILKNPMIVGSALGLAGGRDRLAGPARWSCSPST